MSYDLDTKYGTRKLEIQKGDIVHSENKKDLLIISAFTRGYDPLPQTIIGALNDIGISIKELQKKGHKLILHTYRTGSLLNEAVEY